MFNSMIYEALSQASLKFPTSVDYYYFNQDFSLTASTYQVQHSTLVRTTVQESNKQGCVSWGPIQPTSGCWQYWCSSGQSPRPQDDKKRIEISEWYLLLPQNVPSVKSTVHTYGRYSIKCLSCFHFSKKKENWRALHGNNCRNYVHVAVP